MKYRSVQYGVILISVLCILILVITMLFYYKVQQKQSEEIKELSFLRRNLMIESVLKIKNQQYEAVINENSAWDEFKERIEKNDFDEDWYDENIGAMIGSYEGANVSVFTKEGALVYNTFGEGYENYEFFRDIKVSQLLKNGYKNIFFNFKGEQLFEYFCYGIVSSDDIETRKETPSGFLIMVMEIDSALLSEYSEILGGVSVDIAKSEGLLEKAKEENYDDYFYSVQLVNQYGRSIAYMYFTAENEVEKVFSKTLPVLVLITLIVLVMFLLLLVFIRQNVIRQILTMVKIFESDDMTAVKKMRKNKTEFGFLAGYIEKFFSQRTELQNLNAEMQVNQEKLVSQNDMLSSQKQEIENQIENIKVLNTQIIERNKETEKKNVRIFVQNEQLKQQAQALSDNQSNIEKLQYELQFNNRLLDEANTEMFNSKNYALRLKSVLMVTSTPTKHIFHDFFVYQHFMEKIGGDFVFAKKVGKMIFGAVGDCNLRGIAGSLLSALDVFFLNETIDLAKTAELRPDYILNILNKKIIGSTTDELKTDTDRDGLHISLFMYNTETLSAYFAASKCTMMIVRNGEILEFFGDNLSVGKITDDKQFRVVDIQVLPGDIVYLYSDGCTEIVGGPFCKKLTHANFKKEILKQHVFPLSVQKTGFKRFYEEWIGYLDQSEDISLFSFKI
ncbi:MAG: SpoIIE family protein phosphatase [Bacteroidales bacterium]|nr:SpoIIE family protein phosphatase [Bacteroidales bacterium]